MHCRSGTEHGGLHFVEEINRFEKLAEDLGVSITIGGSHEIIDPDGSTSAGSKWIEYESPYHNDSKKSVWVDGDSPDDVFFDLDIVILVRLVQPLNANNPKLMTLLGIVTLVRLVRERKTSSPILVTATGRNTLSHPRRLPVQRLCLRSGPQGNQHLQRPPAEHLRVGTDCDGDGQKRLTRRSGPSIRSLGFESMRGCQSAHFVIRLFTNVTEGFCICHLVTRQVQRNSLNNCSSLAACFSKVLKMSSSVNQR